MLQKKELRARDVVDDIRSGMTDRELMEKYKLSSKGLTSVFNKLKDARLIEPDETGSHSVAPPDEVIHDQIRRLPRCRPLTKLAIIDLDDVELACYVNDINENGVQVVGLKTKQGAQKTFLIQAVSEADVQPFSFEAVCRWAKMESDERLLAGFEIASISREDLELLRRLIRAFTCE